MNKPLKKQAFLLGTALSVALLLAMFVTAGTALAQVSGVDNEADTCVDESCNSGNVADVDVDGGGLLVAVGVSVLGGGDLVVNDAFNTSVDINQSQVGTPDPISIPGMPEVSGVGNTALTCVEGSCNSGNVASVDVDNGLSIVVSLDLLGDLLGIPLLIDGGFDAQQLDGLLEIELPCTIVAVGVSVLDGGSLTVNDVCNTDVSITQSQS